MQALEVTTADEMYAAALHAFERCDGAVMCAAVADYAPVSVADRKIKKESEVRSIELRPTRDIAAAIGEIKGPRLLVGFALETDHGLEHAEDKLERKNMDMIVLNSLDDPGAGFGVDTNRVTILHRDGGGTLSGSRTSERSLRISRTRSRRSGKRRNNRKFVTFAL